MSAIPRNRFGDDPRLETVSRLFEQGRGTEARGLLRELARETWPGDGPELELAHRPSAYPRPGSQRLAELARLYRDPKHLAQVVGVSVRLVWRAKRRKESSA
jgi:hypothetical protein